MANWTLKEKSIGDMEVVIEGEKWQKAVNKAFNKLAKNVTIDGFRKGSAPKALVERAVPQYERWMRAVEDNANEWMREGFDELKLEPISQPQLDVKDVNPEKVVLVYTFAVNPEVKVSDYKGLNYAMGDCSVSEEELEAEIKSMAERYAELELKEGEAEEGDTVNIDYVGKKDDVPFEGGTADNYDLKLGSHSFIPGFEEQLIGVKAGDVKDLNLKFPEEYHAEELAGADVVFTVKVNEVKTKVLPEIDDDFAKDQNMKDVETLEQLKEAVRKRLGDSKEAREKQIADDDLASQLYEKIEADLPDVLVDSEVQNQINNLANQIQSYGMSFSQYLKMMGQTPETLKEQYRENAEKSVKLRFGLNEIAKLENLEPSDEDIEKELKDISEMYQIDLEQVRKMIDPEMLKMDIKTQKALDFVRENAVKTARTEEKGE